jgi:lipopolysaccharide/colanic/teichoic acid biosynthesis glycosyltransferase
MPRDAQGVLTTPKLYGVEPLDAWISPEELRFVVPGATEPHFAYDFSKRVIDIIASALALAGLAPLFLVVALVNKRSGDVFFRQRRIGLGGRVFWCLKFRSMVPDAEKLRGKVAHLNTTSGPTFKNENDPRITRFGRFIRRTSIDELPQLINVLRGDMSLVGPRPLPVDENRYVGDQHLRLSVKPGLTCIWQVSGRSKIGFDRWMEMDLEYVEKRSLRTDLGLLVQTVPVVLRGEGAF